ncbi:flagellar brake protein [Nitrosomonas marina]|uniref:Flagellar brake protein YcgR n=1 Tax=Nitrosomonas marina TaxID=917 RepID=A0A1H8ESZ9_9PROT|nr:flagellar brake protein [Nitrosomonas marina]SEN22007.1 c-di-GMP-binding flagellar brake protein YcgR, contains PilZNR and PilZ domains [Nitrosomonas marina]
MVETIRQADPADIANDNSNSSELIEICRVNSKVDILHILQEIMQKNTLVTLYFDQSNRFILTSILFINGQTNEILIDSGSDTKFNQVALESEHLIFITSLDKIKIEFVCNQISMSQFDGRDVFQVNFPESLIRMQRRNYYRIITSIIKPLKCIIPIHTEAGSFKAEITMVDLSCGGIGVIDHHPMINFEPGMIYHNCRINLPGYGDIFAGLEVRSTYEITLRNGQICKRAGCHFIDLPNEMETMIQRYVTKQEQVKLTP